MSVLTRWLSRLQLSPRSQRVLTEAALDWRHEVATAKTVDVRILAHLRGTAAIARAATVAIGDATMAGLTVRWLLSFVGAAACFAWIDSARLVRAWYGSHDPADLAIALWPQLFGTLGYIIGLATLIGPRRGTSPAPLFLMVVTVHAFAFAMLWPEIVQQHWTEIARQRAQDHGYRLLPMWAPFVSIGLASVCVFTADRVRIDQRRRRATLECIVALAAIIAVLGAINWTVAHFFGSQSAWGWLPFAWVLGATAMYWLRLVRRQERQQPVHA